MADKSKSLAPSDKTAADRAVIDALLHLKDLFE
jgi:hypothetical protein